MTYAHPIAICAKHILAYRDTNTTHRHLSQRTRTLSRHKPIIIYHNVLLTYRHLLRYTVYPNLSRYTSNKPQRTAPYHQLTATYCDTWLTYRNLSQRIPKTQQPIPVYIQHTATYRDMCSIYSTLSRYVLDAHPLYNDL